MFRLNAAKGWGVTLLSCALGVGSFSRPARAQTDSAAARALFSEGRQLVKAQKYAEACPKFEESLRLDPGIGTQFNLANCWEKLGRTASAWALFLDVAAAARSANQPQREAAAKERASALESKLTRLRVVVPNPSPDEKVFRDEAEIGPAAWGTAMPIDPGDHVVRVTAKNKQEWSQDVKVPATANTLSVNVPPLEDVPAPAEPVSSAEPASHVEASPLRDNGAGGGTNVPAFVIGGVGLAAAAVGTVFLVQSRSDNSEALKLCHTLDTDGKEHCSGTPEQQRHSSFVSKAKRDQIIGFVGIGVGGAAVITAAVMLLTADSGQKETAMQVSPMWDLGASGAGTWGATLSGRF
jgi:hypothetical protein